MLSGLFSSPCVSLCSLHCIGQSQRVRRSSSAVPHAVLTSYTVLNNLVSSLETRGVVPTWETTWPGVITMRTSQHKKPESIRVELAIRAQAGISEVDSKPSSENARPQAGPYTTSQWNRGLLSSVILRSDAESVLWCITIPWLPGPVSAHPFLLILRNKITTLYKVKEPLLNDFWRI